MVSTRARASPCWSPDTRQGLGRGVQRQGARLPRVSVSPARRHLWVCLGSPHGGRAKAEARVCPTELHKLGHPAHSLWSSAPASLLPQYRAERRADAVSRCPPPRRSVSALCENSHRPPGNRSRWRTLGETAPKCSEDDTFPRGLHEPFFGHGKNHFLGSKFLPSETTCFPSLILFLPRSG